MQPSSTGKMQGLDVLIEAARVLELMERCQAEFGARPTVFTPPPPGFQIQFLPPQLQFQQPMQEARSSGSGNNNLRMEVLMFPTNATSPSNSNDSGETESNQSWKRKREKEVHSRQVREQRAQLNGHMDALKMLLPKGRSDINKPRMTTMAMLKGAIKLIGKMTAEERAYEVEQMMLMQQKTLLETRLMTLHTEMRTPLPPMFIDGPLECDGGGANANNAATSIEFENKTDSEDNLIVINEG